MTPFEIRHWKKKVCFFYGDFIEGSNINLQQDNKKGNFFYKKMVISFEGLKN